MERAGFEIKFQVEIDDYCNRVLAKHWPDVPRYGDIRTVTNVERVDVLCGGFPCQDISNAGNRAGINGERSGLWSEYVRLIREIRPRYVIVENVAALLGRGMGRVLGDLSESGYDTEYDCIPAAAVGAPHERDRVFIIAYPSSQRFSEAGQLRHNESSEWIPSRCETGGGKTPHDRKERVQRIFTQKIHRFEGFSWCENVRRVEDLFGRSDIPEPLFRGSCDGIPAWMDRIAACGNAIVPQIAEWIGRRIMEYECRKI